MTQVQTPVQSRREKQREATYDEIVRASRELLAEGAELSLRAVAAKMGMTAPALYRYVASYQELVDLVAFEIDKAATLTFAAAADAAARSTTAPAGWWPPRPSSGCGRWPTRASSGWSSPTRSPTPPASAAR